MTAPLPPQLVLQTGHGRRACNRRLQPTPPTMSTSGTPQCAIARSVISTSIANSVSCRTRPAR